MRTPTLKPLVLAERRNNRRLPQGQTLVEYAMLLVLLALGAITALNTLGSTLAPKYTKMNNEVKTPKEATVVVYVPPAIQTDDHSSHAYIGADLAGSVAAGTASPLSEVDCWLPINENHPDCQ